MIQDRLEKQKILLQKLLNRVKIQNKRSVTGHWKKLMSHTPVMFKITFLKTSLTLVTYLHHSRLQCTIQIYLLWHSPHQQQLLHSLVKHPPHPFSHGLLDSLMSLCLFRHEVTSHLSPLRVISHEHVPLNKVKVYNAYLLFQNQALLPCQQMLLTKQSLLLQRRHSTITQNFAKREKQAC